MPKIINAIIKNIVVECKLNANYIPLDKISREIERKIFETESMNYLIIRDLSDKMLRQCTAIIFKNGKFIIFGIKKFKDIEKISNKIAQKILAKADGSKINNISIRESIIKFIIERPIEDINQLVWFVKNSEYLPKLNALLCKANNKKTKNIYYILQNNSNEILVFGIQNNRQIKEFKDYIEIVLRVV